MNRPDYELADMMRSWEDYDDSLSPQLNLIELQLALGFLDDSREILKKMVQDSKKGI